MPVEKLDQLLSREDFLVAVRPPEARQVVQNAHRRVSHAAILVDADRRVALGELLALGRKHHREMCELGRLEAEGVVQHDLVRRVAQVVPASRYQIDLHGVIVDHTGQVVQG